MPAFVNRSVGSFFGTRDELGTTLWPCREKKSINSFRKSFAFKACSSPRIIYYRFTPLEFCFPYGGAREQRRRIVLRQISLFSGTVFLCVLRVRGNCYLQASRKTAPIISKENPFRSRNPASRRLRVSRSRHFIALIFFPATCFAVSISVSSIKTSAKTSLIISLSIPLFLSSCSILRLPNPRSLILLRAHWFANCRSFT